MSLKNSESHKLDIIPELSATYYQDRQNSTFFYNLQLTLEEPILKEGKILIFTQCKRTARHQRVFLGQPSKVMPSIFVYFIFSSIGYLTNCIKFHLLFFTRSIKPQALRPIKKS